MKKYFSTGLIILLPVVLTLVILHLIIHFLTKPFLNITTTFLLQKNAIEGPFLFLQPETVLIVLSKILIVFVLLGFILFIGAIGNLFLIDYLINWGNYFLHKMPFVNKIYKICQDVVRNFFHSSKKFSKAVLVSFPTETSPSIGFVTGEPLEIILIKDNKESEEREKREEGKKEEERDEKETFISIFVPGTPNPSMGFLFLLKNERSNIFGYECRGGDEVYSFLWCNHNKVKTSVLGFLALIVRNNHIYSRYK